MQQEVTENHISYDDFLDIAKGDIIYYLLPAKESPTDPEFQWRARVDFIHHPSDYMRVTVLMDGYEQDQENVMWKRVVRYEKAPSP